MNSTTESLSFEDLKRGWFIDQVSKAALCIFCGARFEHGRVYEDSGKFYTAKAALRLHLDEIHGGALEGLLSLGKEASGISDVQEKVIRGLCDSKDDAFIAASLGDKALSTVRAHRRNLRIKAAEAKVFLAIMDLLETELSEGRRFVDYGPAMPVQDDRLDVTMDEAALIEAKYFRDDGTLSRIPGKEKHKLVVLRRIADLFQKGIQYNDAQVRSMLNAVHVDHALIRRCLVDYRFIARNSEGSVYERK